MKRYFWLFAILGLGFTVTAQPQFYLGAGIGPSAYTASSGNASSSTSAGLGFNGFFGAGFSEHLAAEVNYTEYGQLSNSSVQFTSVAFMIKAVAPLSYQWHFYGKAGVAHLYESNGNSSASGLNGAVGVSYRINPRARLFAQYQRTFVELNNLTPDAFLFGLRYNLR